MLNWTTVDASMTVVATASVGANLPITLSNRVVNGHGSVTADLLSIT